MTDKFSAKLRAGSEYTFIQIRGVIDEDNQLTSLLPQVEAAKVTIIDLGEVVRINSCGVRDWVNWLGDVQQASREVVLIRCSPAIIGQANMVTNFCGDAIIHSFFAPYYVPSTEMSVDKLLYVGQFPESGPIHAPAFVSEETGEPMEFDDFEESYFAFLSSLDRERLSERIQSLVEHVSPGLELKIRQLNEGNLSQLTGPVATATLTTPPRERPPGGSMDRLISSAAAAKRAAANTVQEQAIPPAVQPPVVHNALPTLPEMIPPKGIEPGPGHVETGGRLSNTIIYALIALAVVVVLILIVLVLTVK